MLTILGIVATCFPGRVLADTIRLKDGRTITGKLVKRTNDSVTIEVGGMGIRYGLGEIERIEASEPPPLRPDPGPSTAPPQTSRSTARPPKSQEVGLERSPSQVFQEVAPAVVVISARLAAGGVGQGSGFLIDPDGVVVTNFHVVAGAETIDVKLKGGRAFPVTGVMAFDPEKDVAVLKIEAVGLPTVSLGDSRRLTPGAKVLVIGSPLGLEYTITDGLFSGSRDLFGQAALQFSAPISPGNSGGPLLDAQGRTVGITTFVRPGGQNLNFAVPIEVAQGLIKKRSPTLMSLEQFAAGIGKAYFLVEQTKEAFLAGNFELAMDFSRQAVAADPSYASAHGVLCSLYGARGRFNEAIAACEQALRLDPNLAWVRSNLGAIYTDLGRHEEAIAEHKRAIALDPNGPTAHYNLGVAYHDLARFDEAIEEYLAALALNPQHVAAHDNLCACYIEKGFLDEAIAECRKALAIDPTDVSGHVNLGGAYRLKGQNPEAIEAFQAAVNLEPNKPAVHFWLGRLYYERGQYELAITHADRAQELGVQAPELTQLLETLKPHRKQPKP